MDRDSRYAAGKVSRGEAKKMLQPINCLPNQSKQTNKKSLFSRFGMSFFFEHLEDARCGGRKVNEVVKRFHENAHVSSGDPPVKKRII